MKTILLPLLVLLLAGCAVQQGKWTWVHAQGYGEEDLWQAIDECEEYATIAEMNNNFSRVRKARPYGGWGSFPFEFCMREKGWELHYLTAATPQ